MALALRVAVLGLLFLPTVAEARNLVQLYAEFENNLPVMRLIDSDTIERNHDTAKVRSYFGGTTEQGDTFISDTLVEVDCAKNILRDAETRFYSAEGKPERVYGPEPTWHQPVKDTLDEAIAGFACGKERLDDWLALGDREPIALMVQLLKTRPKDSI